jgi:hypothetical protein
MGIEFTIKGQRMDYETGANYVQMSNSNARMVLEYLGIAFDYCGEIPVKELKPLCMRRTWKVARNETPAIEPSEEQLPGQCKVIFGGLPENYEQEKAKSLLKLCELAGEDGVIQWG